MNKIHCLLSFILQIKNSRLDFWLLFNMLSQIGNLLSIWVLSMPEMRSTAFNRLLLALAIIDSLFICPGNKRFLPKCFTFTKAIMFRRNSHLHIERFCLENRLVQQTVSHLSLPIFWDGSLQQYLHDSCNSSGKVHRPL